MFYRVYTWNFFSWWDIMRPISSYKIRSGLRQGVTVEEWDKNQRTPWLPNKILFFISDMTLNLCSSKMGWGYGIPTYFHLISLISMKSMNRPSADLPDLLKKVIGAAWSVSWDVIVRGSQHGISGGGDFCFTNSRNKNQAQICGQVRHFLGAGGGGWY